VAASATLEQVRSNDGTTIVFRRCGGAGPPLVVVHGTTGAHWSFSFLAPVLAERFTVYAVDRRGRGESGDAETYAIEREFEDVAAVVDSLDEPATLFGHSYGATVSLGAALLAQNLRTLVLYEPAPGFASVPRDDVERIEKLVAAGKRDEALVHALTSFGLSPAEVDQSRAAPTWSARVAAVQTVAREIRAEEAYPIDPEHLRRLATPTLLLLGEESPNWGREGTERVSAALRDARIALLRGQGHAAIMTAPELVAEEVTRFLSEEGHSIGPLRVLTELGQGPEGCESK
jgi:pimeloyl-ACP methyl ester carboxylesterase